MLPLLERVLPSRAGGPDPHERARGKLVKDYAVRRPTKGFATMYCLIIRRARAGRSSRANKPDRAVSMVCREDCLI